MFFLHKGKKNALIATDQKWEYASNKKRFIKYGSWINNGGGGGCFNFSHSQQTFNWLGHMITKSKCTSMDGCII